MSFNIPPIYKKSLLNLKDSLDSLVDSFTKSIDNISLEDHLFISSRCMDGIQNSLISYIESIESYSDEITKRCNSM